jgi:DNA-binding transcriptional MerR regulator
MENKLLSVGQAARAPGLSEKTIRALEARGLIKADRVANGIRIFQAKEVERFARERSGKESKAKLNGWG